MKLPTATGDIIFGVIIYCAACAVLLARLEPLKFVIRYSDVTFRKDKRKIANSHIANIYRSFINSFKIKKEYNLDIKNMKIKINKENQSAIENLKIENAQIIFIQQKKKSEIENQIQQLKQQYENEINKLSKVNDKVKIDDLTSEYSDKKNKLIAEKKEVLLTINQLNQQLRKNILQIKSSVNHDLQVLIKTKNDKVGVTWAQIQQENKTLNHYMHKQYNAIWKRGKIGNWNDFQNQKKFVYGESLNNYISEKITYENIIYNYKQELIRELFLLKKQKRVLKKSRVKDLTQKYKQQLNFDKKQLKKALISLRKQNISQSKAEMKNLINQFNIKVKTNKKTLHKNIYLLKKDKVVPINSTIATLNQQFTKKLAFEKNVFQQKFNALLQQEKQALMQIKTQKVGGDNNGRT